LRPQGRTLTIKAFLFCGISPSAEDGRAARSARKRPGMCREGLRR